MIKHASIIVERNNKINNKFRCYALKLGGYHYMTEKEIKETGFKVIEK